MTWAKRAAEEIVSDDVIDEAESEKTSGQDWLKWALAAAALGAAGFAAWKYSPEIQEVLSSKGVYSDKALSNRLLEKVPVVGAMSSSPAAWGAVTGSLGQLQFAPAAVRESVLLGGKDAPLRTIPGQLGLASTAGKMNSGWGIDRSNVALAEQVNRGLGGTVTETGDADTGKAGKGGSGGASNVDALTKLYNAGVKTPESGLGKLRTLDFDKLPAAWTTHRGQTLSTDTGLDRSNAAMDLDRISANAVELDRRLGSSVDYKVPQLDAAGKPVLDASGAPVMTPTSRVLREVPEAERGHLAPEHRFVLDAHGHLARDAGVDPTKFRLGDIGKGLSTNRATLRRGFTFPHLVRGAGVGALAGGGIGFGIDAAGKAFE